MYSAYPDSVRIDGVNYSINTDFRVWCRIDELLFGSTVTGQKAAEILSLCYKEKLPPNPDAAFDAVINFYGLGAERKNKRKVSKNARRIISFVIDERYITAAFLSEYNIDLANVQMHWWRFKLLFDGLSPEQRICEIMNFRAMDISKIKDKKQKAYYKRMKSIYKLPDPRSKDEREADMIDVLCKSMGM